jgi:large subunit ribosomal protein L10
MAKTKAQKLQAVKEGIEALKQSETVILTDFTGLSANEMNALRQLLRSAGAVFKVLKKRLLKFVFEKEKIEFDPEKMEGQAGVVFSKKDLAETAGLVYKFSKTKEALKILGGFDVKEKKFIEAAEIKKIGSLPSREVLLAQLLGMLTAPIRQFLFILNERAKKNQ